MSNPVSSVCNGVVGFSDVFYKQYLKRSGLAPFENQSKSGVLVLNKASNQLANAPSAGQQAWLFMTSEHLMHILRLLPPCQQRHLLVLNLIRLVCI